MAVKIGRPGEGPSAGRFVLASEDGTVSWGAIIAGTVCALALQILFTLMAAGMGLELADDRNAGGSLVGPGIFFGVTAIASLFAGGSIAGRMSAAPQMHMSVLHGVVVWALVTIAAAALSLSATRALIGGASQVVSSAGSAVGSVAGSVAGAAGGAVQGAVSAVAPAVEDLGEMDFTALVPASIEADVEQALGPEATPEEVAREVQSLTAAIIDEDEREEATGIIAGAGRQMLRQPGEAGAIFDAAVAEMTAPDGPLGEQQFDELQGELQARYGISEAESAEIADRWRGEFVQARDEAVATYREGYDTVAQELNDAAEAAADAARAAADAAAAAAWWAAFGVFLGLVAAAAGAALGRPEEIVADPRSTVTPKPAGTVPPRS